LEQQKQQIDRRISELQTTQNSVAVVLAEKCTGCGICADVCPVNAITIKERAVVNPDVCTGCAACVYECPNAAIAITQR
jgi:ferredoxin